MQKSVKILFVITLVFLEFVSSDDTEQEVEDLVARYEILMESDSGYVKPEISTNTEELRKLPAETLKNMIELELTNIQCGYVYSSLHLLTLLEILWKKTSFITFVIRSERRKSFGKKQRKEHGKPKDDSIIVVANEMLASVYRFEFRPTLNLMWLFFCYADYLDNYDLGYHHIRKEINPKEFTFVYNELTKFTQEFCHLNNAYNNKFVDGTYYTDVIEIFDDIKEPDEVRKFLLRCKTDLTQRIVKSNHGTKMFRKTFLEFPMHRLRLNRAITNENFIETILKDFGKIENWKFIKEKLENDYYLSYSNHHLIDRLISLGKYQQNFIKVLKIILLQVTWSRLVRIRKFLFDLKSSMYFAIKKFKIISRKFSAFLNMQRLVRDLKYFTNYLGLYDDIQFNSYVEKIYKIKNITITTLNELISNTVTTLNSSYKMLFNCTSTYNAEDTNTLGSFLLSVYINRVMYGIDFNVIQSFIDFTEYLEKFRGQTSENIDENVDENINEIVDENEIVLAN